MKENLYGKSIEIVDTTKDITTKIEKVKEYKTFNEIKDGLSEKELEIYEKADLEVEKINGKDVLIRSDIDYDEKDGFGDTNLERMENGKPPLIEGEPVELHHIEQRSDGPIAELTRSEHRGPENNSVLHDRTKPSEINRLEFKIEREDHWKARAEIIK